MKKLSVFMVLLVLCACSSDKALFKYGEITTIEMSESSKKRQEEIKNSHANDYLKEGNKENVRKYFESKVGQEFPKVEVNNKLEKEALTDGEVYTLSGDKVDAIVIYIHGGAYAFEIDKLHVEFCDKLVNLLNAKVYMPLYQLIYENNYEGAYKLLDELYEEVLKQNKPIYIMGDSAGGGLALGYTEYLNRQGKKLPDKLVLLSPWVDISMTNELIPEYEKIDLTLAAYIPKIFGEYWAYGIDTKDPLVSPLYGDMKGLPDVLIINGNAEITYPDNILLFNKMLDAGVKAAFVEGEGFWHVFPVDEIEEQEICLKMIKQHIDN